MNVGEIVGDAVRYPLSDWKKLLIYGIIGLFTTTAVFRGFIALNGITNIALIVLLVTIELVVSIIFTGYFLRIIKSSLLGNKKLPEFNSGLEMFTDGIKVFLVGIVYIIPIIFLVLVFALLSSSPLEIIVHQTIINGFNPGNVIVVLVGLGAGIGVFIAILYMIIILPIFMVSIANIADNNDELGAAFKFNEIFGKISRLGWIKFILWYIITGIFSITLFVIIGTFVVGIFSLIHNITVGGLLISVVLIPYLYMYFARSAALFYISE